MGKKVLSLGSSDLRPVLRLKVVIVTLKRVNNYYVSKSFIIIAIFMK